MGFVRGNVYERPMIEMVMALMANGILDRTSRKCVEDGDRLEST